MKVNGYLSFSGILRSTVIEGFFVWKSLYLIRKADYIGGAVHSGSPGKQCRLEWPALLFQELLLFDGP